MKAKKTRPSRPGDPQFREAVAGSELFTPPSAPGETWVEFIGRVHKTADAGKGVLLIPARNEWGELALEIDLDDVLAAELLFEDSSGRRTYRVRLPSQSAARLLFHAADLARRMLVESEPAAPAEPIPPWRYDLARQPAPAAYPQAVAPQQAPYPPAPQVQYVPSPYGGLAPEWHRGLGAVPNPYAPPYAWQQPAQYLPAQYTPYPPGAYPQYGTPYAYPQQGAYPPQPGYPGAV
jgi:hypothetical protein